jgi:hypothetical protein
MSRGDGDGEFREAFSNFARSRGGRRNNSPEELLAVWTRFIEDCEAGYSGGADEDYFNDLTSRDLLAEALDAEELQQFPQLVTLRAAVEEADRRFRAILRPDAFPSIPEEAWWARGVVRFAKKQLVEELRGHYGVEVELVE